MAWRFCLLRAAIALPPYCFALPYQAPGPVISGNYSDFAVVLSVRRKNLDNLKILFGKLRNFYRILIK